MWKRVKILLLEGAAVKSESLAGSMIYHSSDQMIPGRLQLLHSKGTKQILETDCDPQTEHR